MEQQKYILTINFNYDSTENVILESRSIKRTHTETYVSGQYLKGAMKEYPSEGTFFFAPELSDKQTVKVEKTLTKNEVRMAMQPSFDLFKDFATLVSQDDAPQMHSLVQMYS